MLGIWHNKPLYRRRFQLWLQSNTVVLLQTNCVKYSLFLVRTGGALSVFKVSGKLHKLHVWMFVHCTLFVRDSMFMCSNEKSYICFADIHWLTADATDFVHNMWYIQWWYFVLICCDTYCHYRRIIISYWSVLGRAVRKLSCWPVRFGNGLEYAIKRVLISGTICRQGANIL